MIRPEYREALESQHKILVALWMVFFAAIFLYLWISQMFLSHRQLAMGSSLAQTAKMFLWALAFIDLATLTWWKKRFLTREAILGEVKRYKLLQALEGHKTPIEERAAAIVSSYVTSKIVAFAMVEAVAIYGFALVLVSGYFMGQYVLSAAAAALLLAEFPAGSFLVKLLDEIEAESNK